MACLCHRLLCFKPKKRKKDDDHCHRLLLKYKKRKKNHRKRKKNLKKGRSLPFFSSSLVFHASWKLWATQAWELSQALVMEWAGNEVREVGGKKFGAEKGAEKSLGRKRMCFWFIPKTAWTASSWTGGLVAAGSHQPLRGPYLPLFFPGAASTCSVKCF